MDPDPDRTRERERESNSSSQNRWKAKKLKKNNERGRRCKKMMLFFFLEIILAFFSEYYSLCNSKKIKWKTHRKSFFRAFWFFSSLVFAFMPRYGISITERTRNKIYQPLFMLPSIQIESLFHSTVSWAVNLFTVAVAFLNHRRSLLSKRFSICWHPFSVFFFFFINPVFSFVLRSVEGKSSRGKNQVAPKEKKKQLKSFKQFRNYMLVKSKFIQRKQSVCI